jgi:glycosyltransferase involved in cell wall biosynthesis
VSLKVLLYAPVHPTDRGGVQAVVNDLGLYLRGRGHRVTTVWGWPAAVTPPGDRSCVLPPLVWRNGLPAPRSSFEVCGAWARCCRRLALERPDVVNVHFVTASALYFLRLRACFRYKVVLSAHGSDVLRPEPESATRLPGILAAADATTAVSQVTADRIAAVAGIPAATVRVIPNGVDYDFWSRPATAVQDDPESPIISSVGRLDPVKGHDVLLRAFAGLLSHVRGVRLVVAGDGGWRPHLERLAADLGISSRVRFAGDLPPEQVRSLLARTRVFVLPSRSEGLPLAPIEAMAAGVPVVAARVGGVPEVVAETSGVLVPPEDPAALCAALIDVLHRPDRARSLTDAGRLRAREFSASAAHAAYDDVLTRACRAPDPRPA